MIELDWHTIDTVLLDMDGTLLDLHFDNQFWLSLVPQKYAEKHQMSLENAKQYLEKEYEKVHGTIDWYCLDYWTQLLDMPIAELKTEIQHLIQMREDVPEFLNALNASGRKVILLTNAHPDSLSLKIERTQLDKYFDELISTHEFGASKESPSLWTQLHSRLQFNPKRTLFVDDSVRLLHIAQEFGIEHVLAVKKPDSQQPEIDTDKFQAVTDYRLLVNDILAPRIE